jgi:hypothetical protein
VGPRALACANQSRQYTQKYTCYIFIFRFCAGPPTLAPESLVGISQPTLSSVMYGTGSKSQTGKQSVRAQCKSKILQGASLEAAQYVFLQVIIAFYFVLWHNK